MKPLAQSGCARRSSTCPPARRVSNREARRIVDAIEEGRQKGLGVGLLDGSLIGPPMEKRARAVLRKIERIRKEGVG